MTGLTRRELLIGGAAIMAAGALPGTAFAAETAERSGFPRDTKRQGEHSMATITVKNGVTIYYKEWGKRQPRAFNPGCALSAHPCEEPLLFLPHPACTC